MLNFGYRIKNDEINRVPLSFHKIPFQSLNGSFIVGAKTINIVLNVDDLIESDVDEVTYTASEIKPLLKDISLWSPVQYEGVLNKTGFKNKIKLTGVLTLKSCQYAITVDLFESVRTFGNTIIPMILKRKEKPLQLLPERSSAGVLQGAI